MRLSIALIALILTATPTLRAEEKPATRPVNAAAVKDQATLEKEFAELLTNAQMTGSFTSGKEADAKQDQYTIIKAVKGEGEDWIITAQISYKGYSLPMDISVQVKWAGDTPVICVTNKKIPGFGTFTARVMFYGKQYAGTWDGGNHGGLMYGRIEKLTPSEKK